MRRWWSQADRAETGADGRATRGRDRISAPPQLHTTFLKICIDDALSRLLLPSLEREIRSELTDEAELHAVKVFAHNIRSLLMQPPLVGRRVLAVDPGYRNGCKLVEVLDEAGNLVEHTLIYPHGG